MTNFGYTSYAQEIIFGPGAITRLGEAAERFGWRRVLICTTGSARRGGALAQATAALGERLAAVYDQVQPHVPEAICAAATALAADHEVDAVIGLGGGSPIGTAKAAAQALEERRTGRPARAAFPTDQPLVPVAAIPTTYAGSEMTPIYGMTREVDGAPRKATVSDAKVAPKLVIYDPLLTLDLPPDLTAATGINALAHCVEALYSITRNPLSTAAALGGIRAIARALPRCHADGGDVTARTEMLMGAHLAGLSLASVAMALHHGICHVLGGTAGVPHGVANSIMLSHVMCFNQDAAAAELALAAEALGIARAGRDDTALAEAAAHQVDALVERMGLPQHLRDVGLREADLPRLARIAFENRTVRSNPQPITEVGQLEELLHAAW
ncbi:MAG: iron-containing alcohol dehydrogenase family protein [Roseiflexaceae bacterium]